ncbi:MAG: hydrogenase maturation protease [Nitrospinae bacterium]|nr:hydrogenase maturation protease [Nitrospinota bacterium]MBL7021045.1 hydrogenase maturation protease [Nitrospinaceae bacterium]
MLIIGIGNLYRCDDAVGILIARKLKDIESDRIKVLEQSGEGTSLMEAWKGYDHVWIIDAVSSGALLGSIHRLDASKESIPSKYFSCSSHNFGVAEAIELARTLGQLPEQLQLYGVEGKNFQPGEILSPEVEQAMELITGEMMQQLSSSL